MSEPKSTPLDLDALEKVAREATPGPWGYGKAKNHLVYAPHEQLGSVAICIMRFAEIPQNGTFIATFDPPTVLRLIEERRALASAFPDLLRTLSAAMHALRSYEFGNASTDLAQEAADACEAAIAKVEGRA